MEDIISDILVLIFNKLDGYDICRFSLTSKSNFENMSKIIPLLDINLHQIYIVQKCIDFFKTCKTLNMIKCRGSINISNLLELGSLNISKRVDSRDALIDYQSWKDLLYLPKLTHLNISGFRIKDYHIKFLPKNLISLDISRNNITSVGIEYLTELNKLQELNLVEINITNFEKILSLTNLKKLYLSNISFSDSCPDQSLKCLSVLTKLKILRIEEPRQEYLNGITELDLDLEEFYLTTMNTISVNISKWSSLTKLQINHNGKREWYFDKDIFRLKSLIYLKLNGIIFNKDHVHIPDKLKIVKLSRCRGLHNIVNIFKNVDILTINSCSDLDSKHFKYFNRISNVSLRSVRIKDVQLNYLENVVILKLDNFKQDDIIAITELPKLKSLTLNWDRYIFKEDINIDILLESIGNLYYLYIGNCSIQDFKLSKLKNLVKFGIKRTFVKDDNFLSLSELKYLTYVYVDRCNISEYTITQLGEKRSDIEVEVNDIY